MSSSGTIFLLIGCVGFVAYKIRKTKADAKRKRIYQLSIIAHEVQNQIDKAKNLKTISPRITALNRVENLLKQASLIENYEEVFSNFHNDLKKVRLSAQILPVVAHYEKSQKQRFKRKINPEKNALLDALYEIKTQGLSNEDFHFAEVITSQGELISVSIIEKRLKELGWTEDDVKKDNVQKQKRKSQFKERMTEDGRYIID